MPLVCIQCSIEAMIEGKQYEPKEETAEEHMSRVHPLGVSPEARSESLLKLTQKLENQDEQNKE